ncbi:site-specific integrase [Chitinophagaceae bacterium LWZ2-11]
MIKRHTFSILPFIRVTKRGRGADVAIYLRITCEGKRAELSLKLLVPFKKWDAKKGRVKGTSDVARIVNNNIDVVTHRIWDIYTSLLQTKAVVSAGKIKDIFLGVKEKQYLFIAQFKLHVDRMKMLEGRGFAKGTIKNWNVTLSHLQSFVSEYCKADDIALNELSMIFLRNFEWHAKTYWHCGTNAIIKHIQRLRKVVNIALENGWIEKNPFAPYKAKQEKTHRTHLLASELKAIENITMKIARLEKVKDLFLFSCYTGLSYVDLEQLTGDNITIGVDGEKWIFTSRVKTGAPSNVPLLPQAIKIIEKYQDDLVCVKKGMLLPVISNMKTNAYLKEIADICGIKKNLTFHMARHTFATTITLSNGVPIETVSRMLGHAKISTTQIYARVLEHKVSQDMKELRRKV